MTIKQYGGVFGRNPTFNNATIDGTLTVDQIVEKTGAAGIALDGVTLKDGNVVLADGKGIDFSATAGTGTSELFSMTMRRETWSPNQGAGLTVVGAFTSSGTYTKIGRQVTINGRVNGATSIAAALGSVICTNLPFATNGDFMGVAVWNSAQSSSSFFAQTSTVYAVEAISASPAIYFTLTYFV
jgi:hypothetical protein